MSDEQGQPTPTEKQDDQQPPNESEQFPLAQLQRDLEETRSKEQEFRNLLQRVQADFVNYRRRMDQERMENALSERVATYRTILPVLDDFARAIDATPPDLAQNDWVQGIMLVLRKLRTTLEQQGVQPIEALGRDFDPWEHEAVLSEVAGPENAGKVIGVLREGYKLDGRVIRPAQVKVGL